MTIKLAGIENNSTVDWLGHVATVFFLPGCDLRCRMCFNHEILNSEAGKDYSIKEIEDILTENSLLCDSIVITGGEPMLHPEYVEPIIRLARIMGFLVMLNTNGYNSPIIREMMKKKWIDKIATDVKAPLYIPEYAYTVGGNRWALDNELALIKAAYETDTDIEIRTTVFLDKDSYSCGSCLEKIIDQIIPYTNEYHLQQFIPDNALDVTLRKPECSPSLEYLMEYAKKAKTKGIRRVVVKTPNEIIEL